MSSVRRFVRRLGQFIGAGRGERELAKEVDAHLSLLEQEYSRRGRLRAGCRPGVRFASNRWSRYGTNSPRRFCVVPAPLSASTGRLRPFERHYGFEPSPGANGRANREPTADRLQPLAHAEQPEPGVAIGVDVESHALIRDD